MVNSYSEQYPILEGIYNLGQGCKGCEPHLECV